MLLRVPTVSGRLPNCPLIVDTAHDGYRLTSVDNGVRFDLDARWHAGAGGVDAGGFR
jgi:hypothetical protein